MIWVAFFTGLFLGSLVACFGLSIFLVNRCNSCREYLNHVDKAR